MTVRAQVSFGLALLALAVLVAATTSCAPGKREAASLVEAVDRYRRAEMASKGPLADALDAVPCTVTEVCAAKTACIAASRPTAEGVALKAEVETSLAALHAGKITQEEAASRNLPAKLGRAGLLLDEGYAKLPACDARITALRLRYGL
jgi:hypothetical protein